MPRLVQKWVSSQFRQIPWVKTLRFHQEDVYKDTLDAVPNLNTLVATHQPKSAPEDTYFLMEFLLWGLEANKRLNKYRTLEGFQFKDGLGNLLAGL